MEHPFYQQIALHVLPQKDSWARIQTRAVDLKGDCIPLSYPVSPIFNDEHVEITTLACEEYNM